MRVIDVSMHLLTLLLSNDAKLKHLRLEKYYQIKSFLRLTPPNNFTCFTHNGETL